LEDLLGGDWSGDHDMDGRVVLKWILEKWDLKSELDSTANGRFLWIQWWTSGFNNMKLIRSVAFPETEYNEVLLGYQLGQVVEWW